MDENWRVIVKAGAWSEVASGTEAEMVDVVNLYHSERPDLDAKVRMISPQGAIVGVTYGPTTLKDALPLVP